MLGDEGRRREYDKEWWKWEEYYHMNLLGFHVNLFHCYALVFLLCGIGALLNVVVYQIKGVLGLRNQTTELDNLTQKEAELTEKEIEDYKENFLERLQSED